MTQTMPVATADGQVQATKPKVVVISGWGNFGEVGEREILERAGCEVVVVRPQNEDEAIAAARDADAIITSPVLTKRFLQSLERCRVIACSSIGMDKVEAAELAIEKG